MEPKVEDVQYTLTQIDSRFSELLTRMDTLFTKIDTQQTQLDSQQTQLDSQQTQLDSQQTQLDSQQTQLDSQQTQLDSLQSQLTALMDTSQNKQSRLDGAAKETASQQTQMTDRQTDEPTDRLDQLEQTTCPTPRDCSELPAGATTGVHLLRPGLGRSQSQSGSILRHGHGRRKMDSIPKEGRYTAPPGLLPQVDRLQTRIR